MTAQDSTPSHRLLGNGLPTMSGGQSQMELLRRLQMLSGAAQAKSNNLPNSQKPDPEMLNSLQRAMQNLPRLNEASPDENLQARQRTGRSPDRSTDEAGSAGSALSTAPPDRRETPRGHRQENNLDRSRLQRIAEQMGLSLDGSDKSQAGAASPETGISPPLDRPENRSSERPIPPGESSRQSTEQGNRRPLSSETGLPQQGSSEPGGTRSGNGQSAVDGTRSSGDGGLSEQSSRALPGAEGSGSTTTDDNEPPKSSMRSLLDWLAGRDSTKPDDGQSTRSDNSTSPGSRISEPGGSGNESARSATDSSRRSNNSVAGRDSRVEPQPSVADDWFLTDIADPRKPGIRQNGTSDQNRSTVAGNSNQEIGVQGSGQEQTNDSGSGEDSADKPAPTAEDRLNAQRDERLDELRDSSKSLRQKLIEIAKLARTESGRETSSSDEAEPAEANGLQSVFVDALQEATKGLAEQVDEIVTRDRMTRSERNRWRPERREERGGPFGQLGRFGNRASEWLADSVEPEVRPEFGAANGFSGPNSSEISGPLKVLLALLIGGGFVYWLQQRRLVAGAMQGVTTARKNAPATLRSRQDIVQAFHDLAAGCPTIVADWWTHDRAAHALAVSRPEVDDEVRQLAQLYEQARYLPDGLALSDEQLAAAKAAWLRCRKS